MWMRIVEEAPTFFTYYNIVFLLEAMGVTFALSAAGCLVGLVVGFAIAVSAQTRSMVLLPLRLALSLFVQGSGVRHFSSR